MNKIKIFALITSFFIIMSFLPSLTSINFGIISEQDFYTDDNPSSPSLIHLINDDWKKDFLQNRLDDEERNLWLSTALGLGTAGWSAYEGARRNRLTEQDVEENRAFRKRMMESK